jgi:hypothetical protein
MGCIACASSLANHKHGLSRHYLTTTLASIKNRCRNPNAKDFYRYGCRGIKCLFESPNQILAEIGERPSPRYTIDRIDNDGHYAPGNIRWATLVEQAKNSSNAFWLEYEGSPYTSAELSRLTGIQSQTLRWRYKHGKRDAELVAPVIANHESRQRSPARSG